jgi:hypothetical protein
VDHCVRVLLWTRRRGEEGNGRPLSCGNREMKGDDGG